MDAVVFRANDYIDPSSSSVFSELMRRPTLVTHAQNFAAVCRAPIEKTPTLEDFLAGKNIPAGAIQIGVKPQEGRPKPGYMGNYDVLSATNYEACLRHVGYRVEVIGRIVEVRPGKTTKGKHPGKPYIFLNFGPWQGSVFKVSIWSDGLAALSKKPDASWVGKWISVVGLMEPPYVQQAAQLLASFNQRDGQRPDDDHFRSRGQVQIDTRTGQKHQPGCSQQDQGAADDGAPAEQSPCCPSITEQERFWTISARHSANTQPQLTAVPAAPSPRSINQTQRPQPQAQQSQPQVPQQSPARARIASPQRKMAFSGGC